MKSDVGLHLVAFGPSKSRSKLFAMPLKKPVQGAAPTRLSSVPEGMSKTAQRIVAAVGQLQRTVDIDTPQERMEAFCAMMRSIREEPDACELAEADPVAYMGKYVNEQARIGDAIHLCTLVKKLRAVDTADSSTIHAFYVGMIEHAKGRKRLFADLPDEVAPPADLLGSPYLSRRIRDWEAQLRLLQMLEVETRARVSASAADGLQQYAQLLAAKVELTTTLNMKKP